jgi:uncharacterized membrane protein YedE/YeeE
VDIGFLISLVWAAAMFGVAYFLPRYQNGKSCIYMATHPNYKMTEIELSVHEETSKMLTEGSAMPVGPSDHLAYSANNHWAPKSDLRWLLTFVGAIIGAVVVLEMFLHQIFGESTTYSWIVGYLWLPSYSYSQLVFKTIGWEPYSDIGTLLGSFLAAIFVSRRFQAFNAWIPKTWQKRFGSSELKRDVGVFLGSYLVLFGARMAGGCASGHILSGDLQMALSSIEFFAFVAFSLLITGRLLYGGKRTEVNA